MPSSSGFGDALETLFRELNERWLAAAPREQIVTDERVLRELSLPAQSQTRLCYFAVPTPLLSFYRELVFPLVDRAHLVPASGQEVSGSEGSGRAAVDSLLQRARAVIGDVSYPDRAVWSELRAATLRSPAPRIAIVAERDQAFTSQLLPDVTLFLRPALAPPVGRESDEDELRTAWLEDLATWLRSICSVPAEELEEEALRFLEQGLYRSAVIAMAGAAEVALKETLEHEGR